MAKTEQQAHMLKPVYSDMHVKQPVGQKDGTDEPERMCKTSNMRTIRQFITKMIL